MRDPKTKVVILGGGCGGVTTAFWLSSSQALRDRYDVTLYTRGWRLGGKGASGRNQDVNDRIEEHGLHMWMGCYENAFHTLRACYDAWAPGPRVPIRTWREAFSSQLAITLQQQIGTNPPSWTPWHFDFTERPGLPGSGDSPSLRDLFQALADWVTNHLKSGPFHGYPLEDLLRDVERVREAAKPGIDSEELRAATNALAQSAQVITVDLLDADRLGAGVGRGALPAMATAERSRALILADLGLRLMVGVAKDIFPYGNAGYYRDEINALDLRAWFIGHGAARASVDSAAIRTLYDLAFAYPGGDESDFSKGRAATGVGLRFVMELAFGYKGAPLWKMNAGMGDVIFTPFFQVLKSQGVNVRFFHRLTQMRLSKDGTSVASITLKRQAEITTPPYRPLVTVKELDCWPSQPLWQQLVDGDALKANNVNFESADDGDGPELPPLTSGTDFDVVVLAVPPAMAATVAPDFLVNPQWKQMIDHSAAVATQAFQLWLGPTLVGLGWKRRPPVLSAYAAPFDTWADMSHLLKRESWSEADAPRSIAYFCGAMHIDAKLPIDPMPAKRVESDAMQWMLDNLGAIWPSSAPPGKPMPADAIVSKYFRANLDPSELYVQTPPGSVRYRLESALPIFRNLYIAGDWTLTRYSGGCVESAVESGMHVARALCGEPRRILGR